MINDILDAAAIPNWPARCPAPPPGTYAIYFDGITTDGPDGINRIFFHDAMVELYEPTQDDAAEAELEAELNTRGLRWTKQARYWIASIQRYQTIYEFSYIVKT